MLHCLAQFIIKLRSAQILKLSECHHGSFAVSLSNIFNHWSSSSWDVSMSFSIHFLLCFLFWGRKLLLSKTHLFILILDSGSSQICWLSSFLFCILASPIGEPELWLWWSLIPSSPGLHHTLVLLPALSFPLLWWLLSPPCLSVFLPISSTPTVFEAICSFMTFRSVFPTPVHISECLLTLHLSPTLCPQVASSDKVLHSQEQAPDLTVLGSSFHRPAQSLLGSVWLPCVSFLSVTAPRTLHPDTSPPISVLQPLPASYLSRSYCPCCPVDAVRAQICSGFLSPKTLWDFCHSKLILFIWILYLGSK